jgi:hypothetical protein
MIASCASNLKFSFFLSIFGGADAAEHDILTASYNF